MKHQNLLCLALACLSILVTPTPSAKAQEGLVISEFLAVNVNAIKDDFGDNSDYIELFNGSATTINLNGYYLTDNRNQLTQWQLPSTNMVPGQSLLIWASGRDRRTPGAPLHTNFRLGGSGESVVLTKPDGTTVVHGYDYGLQVSDRSYGLDTVVLSQITLLSTNATAKYLVPTNSTAQGSAWITNGYNDSTWLSGPAGLGFDTNPASIYAPFIRTDVRSLMFDAAPKRSGLYVRIPFQVADQAAISGAVLKLRYDDGVVIYLNDKEIFRRNAPTANLSFSSTATANRTNNLNITQEELAGLGLNQNLRVGANLLAIQLMNRANTDGDALLEPEIISRTITYQKDRERYFATPTPGLPNSVGFEGSSGAIQFSRNSTTYFSAFDVEITPALPAPGGVIRFTTNGTIPTTNSTLYTGPLRVTNSLQLRARLFEPGFLPGPVKTVGYARLSPGFERSSSDLPIILVHNFGGGDPGDIRKPGWFYVFEPERGRTSLTNAPTLVFRAGFNLRGSSTRGNPKFNLAVEAWDEDEKDVNVPLLGMPSDAEWVFHAPFNFDPSLIHNPLASEMSWAVDRYAARARFAEVYINTSANATNNIVNTNANYFGIYNILERIAIGKDRVNIPELTDADVAAPDVTGGYLMVIDRPRGDDPGFTGAGQNINYINPSYTTISAPARDAQEKYIAQFFKDYGAALASRSFTNPVTGYTPFIDRGAAIDHHIINVIGFNVDALRLSGYLYKERNGPLVFGPVWDFDRGFGSTDGRDENPLVWRSASGDLGTDFFNYPWWDVMFKDPNFWQAYVDRYQQLREGVYSNKELMALIDRLNAKVAEAAPRDLRRWSNAKRGGTQATEIAYLKNWLLRRVGFMDSQFLGKPQASVLPGTVLSGTQVTLTAPAGSTIYYKLDGTDPRQIHGGIDPSARIYNGPITITQETRLVARSRNTNHKNLTGANNPPISTPWSGPMSARYTTTTLAAPGDLVLNELNFHPTAPSAAELTSNVNLTANDFEFVELKNVSSHSIDLFGARFTKGITYTFGSNPAGKDYQLESGGIVLLVRNPAAFQLRYGNNITVHGVYEGELADNGEQLQLEDSTGAILLEVTYNDSWQATADGLGFTLNAVLDSGFSQSNKKSWRASSKAGGSPGAENPDALNIPRIVVNEILANSDSPEVDTIEVANLGAAPADIAGWYLTDDRKTPKKYRFPANSAVGAGGYRAIREAAFGAGANGFALSSKGDEAWLFAADAAGNLLGYSHGFSFDASEVNVSSGRYVNSVGRELLVPLISHTAGTANTAPRVGPIVISEIHYHPSEVFANGKFWDNNEDEFIELQNISAAPVTLVDPAAPTNSWRIRGGSSFKLPVGTTIPAGGALVIVNFDPVVDLAQKAQFTQKFGVPSSAVLVGPYKGKLDNSSEGIRLEKPIDVDTDNGDITYVVVDEVEYSDTLPWQGAADGAGASLQKRNGSDFGNDPVAWTAAFPTPGANLPSGGAPIITEQPADVTGVGGQSATFTVTATGDTLRYQWRRENQNIQNATNRTLTVTPLTPGNAGLYGVTIYNAFGTVDSDLATLTVLTPATIVRQPSSQNVKPGVDVTLDVLATGTGPLTYQWLFKGTPIPGATSSVLSLPNIQLRDTGSYQVTVRDNIGPSTSEPAVINVLVAPTITLQPQSLVSIAGDNVRFFVEITEGLEPMSFVWRRSTTVLRDATNLVLTLNNVSNINAGTYTLNISNLAVSNLRSSNATLIVMSDFDKDGMGDQWEAQYGFSTNNVADGALDTDGDGFSNKDEFRAGTDPNDKNSYLKIDSLVSTTNGTSLSFIARTNRGYTIQFKESLSRGDWQSLVQVPGRTNQRTVTVSDPLPTTGSRLYRVVTPQVFPASATEIRLLESPGSQTVLAGDPVIFGVTASGEGVLSYQWFLNGTALFGKTEATLEIPSAETAAQGAYTVRVTDDNGSITTAPATLTVLLPPTIVTQPQSQSLPKGASVTFTVTSSTPGVTYRWIKNNRAIEGATGASLTVNNIDSDDAGFYRVLIRSVSAGGTTSVLSDAAELRVIE